MRTLSLAAACGRLVCCVAVSIALTMANARQLPAANQPAAKQTGPVSFYRQVRPILQRSCSGCHQAAKRGGKLLLTSYDGLKAGGENGLAFVAGKPEESLVVQYISGTKPEMPKNGEPLKPLQVELISKWVREGAKDDTPASVQDPVTAENPPNIPVRPSSRPWPIRRIVLS